jgi:hypothetical protein
MPIVICRACKSYAGKAINYITGKKKAERITTHGLDESRSLAQQFIDTAMLHGKGDTYDERKYYHIKISFEPKDRIENGGKLNCELAEKIANEYFEKQYGNHEYILATHSDKEHIHCHAVINAVSFESGKKIQHSNKDLSDMKDQVNDVAEKYDVSRFDWREAVKQKRQKAKQERATEGKELTQAEKYIQERNGEGWSTSSWKETLREKIAEAKGQCASRTEFQKYLFDNYGVEMPRNTEKTVSFKHPAVAETVRGVKLGAEYTAESIDQALKQNISRLGEQERKMSHAELRPTEKRTSTTSERSAPIGGADIRTGNENNIRAVVSANEQIRSGANESGEFAVKTDIDRLYGKLQEIRGLDKRYNPEEQRRAAEADKHAAQQAGREAERLESEQRQSKQRNKRRSRGDER